MSDTFKKLVGLSSRLGLPVVMYDSRTDTAGVVMDLDVFEEQFSETGDTGFEVPDFSGEDLEEEEEKSPFAYSWEQSASFPDFDFPQKQAKSQAFKPSEDRLDWENLTYDSNFVGQQNAQSSPELDENSDEDPIFFEEPV
jgi:hypothetical protein